MTGDTEQLQAQINKLQRRVEALENQETPTPQEPIPDTPEELPEEKPTPTPSSGDGSSALAWAGGIIFSLGLIFLVAYAINQGWITPTTQIVLGVLTGVVLAAAGQWLHEQMQLQGSILSGVGVVVAYFSIYAGYTLESYRAALGLNYTIASLLLVAVLLGAGALALKQRTPALLIEALVLTQLASYIGSFSWLTTTYIGLFTIAYAALTYKKEWTAALWVGAAITFFFTFINVILRASEMQSYVLTASFTIPFVLAAIAKQHHIASNGVVLATYLLALTATSNQESILTLVAAALSLGLYAAHQTTKHDAPSYLIAGIAYLALWVPVEFSGMTIPLAWTLIATILAYGHYNGRDVLAVPAAIMGLLATGSVLIYAADAQSYERLATIGFYALTTLALSYLYATKNHGQAHAYYLAGLGSLVVLVALELSEAWITVAWGLLATTSLVLGLQTNRPTPKNAGLGLLGLAVAKLFFIDTLLLSEGLRVVAYITLGALLLVGSIVYKKFLD